MTSHKRYIGKHLNKSEKSKIHRQNLLFFVSLSLTIVYLGWRLFFTLPFSAGIAQVIFGLLLFNAEAVTYFTTFELFYRRYKSNKCVLDFPEVDHKYYPDVDVFIATHNEPLDILYKTANACTFMEYPDKNKVHIYFCDDGNRSEVANLATSLGIGYLGLANNTEAKSGNLNHALSKTNSPLIATFDADMIPQRTFLMKTVPYFFLPNFIKENGVWRERRPEERNKDYKIGLIQTPQSFYNPDLFQFNLYSENSIPNEQDFFSREVNIMRNSSNAIAYTGSNTVISRQAMEDIGGFPYHTITEDFETSIRIQKENYITYATSEIQAAGLTTTDVKSMIKQRKRWAQGVIQSLQNTRAIFSPKLSTAARITYFTAYLYWWSFFNRMIFILAPILFALFDFRVVDCTFEQLMMIWLPFGLSYSFLLRSLYSNVRTNRWSQVIDTIFSPFLIICVMLESLGIHEKKFKVTSKARKDHSNFIYAIPHVILTVLSVFAIIRFSYGKTGLALAYSSFILFWLASNLSSLLYALLFMIGRKAHRSTERIRATEQISVSYANVTIPATTIDLSDDGMLFFHEQPIYLPEDESYTISMHSAYYHCELRAKTVYVKEQDEKWYYAVQVEPIDEENKRHYFQFIYDRTHSLPMSMDTWSTMSDDLRRNLERRFQQHMPQRRKQARVDIGTTVTFGDGTTGYICDFNYKYFSISKISNANHQENSIYTLTLWNGVVLKLKCVKKAATKNEPSLFELMNLQELIEKGVDINNLSND